jgi:DNA-binding MarR family transcriptional regulator
MSTSAEPDAACPSKGSAQRDIAWLLHRAAQRLRVDWDTLARSHGLRDLRDWIVLTEIAEGNQRTQLAIGHKLALDKTTLTSLLDRLERDGFVIRTVDPADRRARIAELTDAGRAVQCAMIEARDEIDEAALAGFSSDDRAAFLTVLTRMAGVGATDEKPLHGSCMR